MMKKTALIGMIVLLAGSGCFPSKSVKAAQNQPGRSTSEDQVNRQGSGGSSMRVLWTISGYVVGSGSDWSDQEAKGFLFKPLDIRESAIVFDGQVCEKVTFEKETVESAEYLPGWRTTASALGIEEQKLEVFRTNCTIEGFREYMRLSDSRLIVPIRGVFFFFEPAVSY
jgi:hypothetical protein